MNKEKSETMSRSKNDFAHAINELTQGLSHPSMTKCENYGMTWGCDIDCPVLRDGDCELKDSENKELYQAFLEDN